MIIFLTVEVFPFVLWLMGFLVITVEIYRFVLWLVGVLVIGEGVYRFVLCLMGFLVISGEVSRCTGLLVVCVSWCVVMVVGVVGGDDVVPLS